MGTPTIWDRFRYWIRPLCAMDDRGRELRAWVWQRRKIERLDALHWAASSTGGVG